MHKAILKTKIIQNAHDAKSMKKDIAQGIRFNSEVKGIIEDMGLSFQIVIDAAMVEILKAHKQDLREEEK